MKTTHDCTECPVRKLMDKHFPPERSRDYDIDEDLDDEDLDDEDPDGFFMNTYYYDGDSYDNIPGFRD